MRNKKIMSNFIWRFAERCGAQSVTFIVSIVLARLLEPSVYGQVALVTVFTTILNVFVDSGMANALIQKKDADDVDFSSVFYFNVVWCLILYFAMFVLAPYIADFYDDISLVPVIRVLSLTIVISGVKNVQQAYISRTLQFKRFFFATLGGTITAAVVGIAMAYYGYGIWALVAQYLLNAAMDTFILWLTVKWRPKWKFSLNRLKKLISYGWKLLVSSLLDTIYKDLRQLIIGKLYSSEDLAYYNRGKQFPNLVITNINTSIDSVLLPVMSKEQDDWKSVRKMTRRAIRISTYTMAPLIMGMAFTASSLVELILTDTWLPCVPFLRIFCITYLFYPIHTANLNAIKAMGRSDLFLKLEIEKKIVGIVLLVSTMRFGVMAMTYSLFASSVASQIINSRPNKKLLNYSYLEQLKDILPNVLLAVFMGICINFIELLELQLLWTLVLQVILGMFVYIGGSVVTKNDSFWYLWNIVKSVLSKPRNS